MYSPAAVTAADTEPALWFKIAVAFQAHAGIVSTGTPQTSPAQPGDTPANILRAAHALQSLA